MASRKGADSPLAVTVPAPDADGPSWVKVGVIAAAGFVIGVGWPRLMGVRLGPSAPADSTPAAAGSPARAGEASSSTAPAGSASAALAPAPPVPAPPETATSVVVGRGIVISCRTDDGESKKGVSGCGSLGAFDGVARPRLSKLSSCPAARGATGKISAVFSLDFKSSRLGVEVGKSSTIAATDAFASCLRSSFQGVSIGPIPHEQAKYAVSYAVTIGQAPAAGAPSAAPPPTPEAPSPRLPSASPGAREPDRTPPSSAASMTAPADDGSAQVVWEVALVRDKPRTGDVVARLPRGSKVHVGSGEDGWFKVQFGTGLSTEGYVYRGAIGK